MVSEVDKLTEIPENEILNNFLFGSKKLEYNDCLSLFCRSKYELEILNQIIRSDILDNKVEFNILVLGDVMLDSTMHMTNAPYDQVLVHDELKSENVFVLLTEDPTLYNRYKITSSDQRSLGGAAGIVATLLEIPNVHVDMIGIIGNDWEGNEVKELFKNLPNSTHPKFYSVVIDEYPTVTKYYYHYYNRNQDSQKPIIYRFDRENSNLIYKHIDKYKKYFDIVFDKIGTNYNCIIINDYEKGMVNDHVIDCIKRKFKYIDTYVDPKYNFEKYESLTIKAIIPNIKEASMGIRGVANREVEIISEKDVKDRVDKSDLRDEDYGFLESCLPNCASFIIKADKKGAIIYSKENEQYTRDYIHPLPLDQSEIKSSIGCGDTFDAYYIIGQLKGYSQQTSVKLANIAAGIKRKKELGKAVSPKEISKDLISFIKCLSEEF